MVATTAKRPMFGGLIRKVVVGSVAFFVLVQAGWWASDRLPGWMQWWRIRAAATDLRSPATTTFGPAIRVLGHAQPRSLPWLVEAARDADADIRFRALQAIDTPLAIHPEAVPILIAGLDDPSSSVQSLAILLVGSAGPEARAAAPRLVEMTKDERPHVRLEAARALRRVNPAAEATYRPIFLAFLTDPDPTHYTDRTSFAAELADQGPAARDEAIQALRSMLTDAPRQGSRQQAIQCLGRIGSPARAALPDLARVLGDDDDLAARCFAVEALAAIEGADSGRTHATLEDLSHRGLLPLDFLIPVEKFLELGLTDESELPLARDFLDQIGREYQRLDLEADRDRTTPPTSPAP